MKYSFFTSILLLIFVSCQGQQSNALKQLKAVEAAILENRPGTMQATETGWTMTAKLNGKAWKATSILPPELANRLVGYFNDEYIGLPFNSRYLELGKKDAFADDNVTDLSTNDDIGIWGGHVGDMEITKVEGAWMEGKFHFTASANNTDKTIVVTDGFFRVKRE